MNDKSETTGWTDGSEGCNCHDCRPCADARCMEIRRREHMEKVARLRRAQEQ